MKVEQNNRFSVHLENLNKIKASFEEYVAQEASRIDALKQIQRELGPTAEIIEGRYVRAFDKNGQQYTVEVDRSVKETKGRYRPKRFTDGDAIIKGNRVIKDGKDIGPAYFGEKVEETKYSYSRGASSKTDGIEYEELKRRLNS